MEQGSNRYMAVSYKLYATDEGETDMVEEAPVDKPFQFVTGFGMALDGFEKAVAGLNKGEKFDFTLPKEQAYGEYMDERVVKLDRSIFTINGHFDHDNIFVDAVVPLQNEDGNRFYGHVLEITDANVTVDLNHELAGMDLRFVGEIVEARPLTDEELQAMVKRMNGDGCGCGCGDDNCGCHHHHEGDGDCNHHHGHHNDDGCGCGHCH